MILDSFYLSEKGSLERLLDLTELESDEIESLVGRFRNHSQRAGKLRGEVLVHSDNSISIRHHFTKKEVWKGFLNEHN